MRFFLAPSHLLFLGHELADYPIGRKLHKFGRNSFPIALAIAIVEDELLVVDDVSCKLGEEIAMQPEDLPHL